MSDIDAVAGMYNIIVSSERESAEYRVPVEEFVTKLENRNLPNEICVAGLEDVLTENEELRNRLVSTMRQEMDYLNSQRPLPAIQFVVDGDLQGAGDSYEVDIDGEFYSLQPVFGRQIKKRDSGWLVAPLRV
ncbi:hypothetical protein SAMN04487949_3287 [Halogranum gelatinilyticum]|uniref:DUF8076 domain-containing protein n=1 Tax=Halogranum gelatinilyticum TaxID=660521 RepID=A0A1G9YG56_9EURY|nr:hypothetical protein [Halogranum gelatinilyticum]SDN08007.1 hypothetical protein SAMN04487949_3287 [Halogranum gelatinilyticum]